jgi:hypothetical protein
VPERDPNTEARNSFEFEPPWVNAYMRALSALEQAGRALEQERQLREQIEDDLWPYEWQVATAEREKRKAAEGALEQERDENAVLWEVLRTSARQVNLTLATAEEWSAAERRMDAIRRAKLGSPPEMEAP